MAVAPNVEVQAVRGDQMAGVGVLLSPRGVDKSQAGVPCAGGVEEVDQGVAPPGLVGGLLLAAAIVEVFIGALVEAFPHRRRPRVVVVGEGVGVARGAHATASCAAPSGGTCRGVAA